jgi:hypothetical protein
MVTPVESSQVERPEDVSMSNTVALKPMSERRIPETATGSSRVESDAKVDALVAELRKVRVSVGMLLRANDLAVLKSERNAA